MTSTENTGGPAFPANESHGMNSGEPGMTLREYAAIKLKVPDSGTDWLDDMIRASLRDDFAAKAMQAIVSTVPHLSAINPNDAAEEAYGYADSMLKVRNE